MPGASNQPAKPALTGLSTRIGAARWPQAIRGATLMAMARRAWHLGQVKHLAWVQDGVVARRQIIAAGGTDRDITRLLRRRELTQVYRGIYVNHTGRLSWTQRQWAGVLAFWPAALAHVSALPDPPTAVLHVAVAPGRNLRTLQRIVIHRTPDLETPAELKRNPPADRVE